MTLTAAALTTLVTMKDELGITDDSENVRLERLIEQASSMIVAFLGRKLHYEAAIVEAHPGQGDESLMVNRPPLWSIGSITFDGQAVLADDYSIHDVEAGVIYNKSGWVSTARLGGGIAQAPKPGSEENLYEVTYAGGWQCPNQEPVDDVDALPLVIESACIALVTTLRSRKGRDRDVRSESMLGYSVSYGAPSAGNMGIPDDIAASLLPYRFVAQGT